MKHEAMARAMSELDDELIAQARSYAPLPRAKRAFPRILAAAACLALVLSAALMMQRPQADIYIGGTRLSGSPVPIDQPAPLSLEQEQSAQPLCLSLSFESRTDEPLEITVSDGTLDPSAGGETAPLSSRTVSGGETVTWTIPSPREDTVYTLCVNGRTAAVLRYDTENACWTGQRA